MDAIHVQANKTRQGQREVNSGARLTTTVNTGKFINKRVRNKEG